LEYLFRDLPLTFNYEDVMSIRANYPYYILKKMVPL